MERLWYFYDSGQRVGPVLEEEMRGRAAAGTLRPEVLVWSEGMKEWKAAGEVTEWVFGAMPEGGGMGAGVPSAVLPVENAGTGGEGGANVGMGHVAVLGYVQKSEEVLTLSPRVMDLMAGMGPWLRFMGVLGYVVAALSFLFGIIISLGALMKGNVELPAWAGLMYLLMGAFYLFPSRYLNRSASAIGRLKRLHRSVDLEEALAGQRAFWRFCGICMIVLFAGYFLVIAVVVIVKLR